MADVVASTSQAEADSVQPTAGQVPANSLPVPTRPGGRAAVIRMYVLLGVLATLLFALWYDYKVARVGVDRAYASVSAMNEVRNAATEHIVMSRADVRQLLGRTPDRIFQEGYMTIEEYGWPAGFPIEFRGLYSENPEVALRTHNYYAVYFGNRLSTHYKFFLPLQEIRASQEPPSGRGSGTTDPPMIDAADYYVEMAEGYRSGSPGATFEAAIPDSPPVLGVPGRDQRAHDRAFDRAFNPDFAPAVHPAVETAEETEGDASESESPAESSRIDRNGPGSDSAP